MALRPHPSVKAQDLLRIPPLRRACLAESRSLPARSRAQRSIWRWSRASCSMPPAAATYADTAEDGDAENRRGSDAG